MPLELTNVLKSFGDLAVAFQQQDAKGDANLMQALGALKDPMSAVVTAAGQTSAAAARKTLQSQIAFDKGTELHEFFENIADSLIAAQKQLDISSESYSKAAALAGIPATRFAIPNVHAELRFGFSNLTGKGINVLLFSTEKQREEHSESTVSFDLVATAPEPKQARLPEARSLGLVLGPRRDAVLEKVLDKIDEDLKKGLLTEPARSLATVFEHVDSEKPRFLVVWPASLDPEKPESWKFLVIAVLQGDSLVRDIFEFRSAIRETGDILLIPTDTELKKMVAGNPDDLRKLVTHLGDVLTRVCMLVSGKATPSTA